MAQKSIVDRDLDFIDANPDGWEYRTPALSSLERLEDEIDPDFYDRVQAKYGRLLHNDLFEAAIGERDFLSFAPDQQPEFMTRAMAMWRELLLESKTDYSELNDWLKEAFEEFDGLVGLDLHACFYTVWDGFKEQWIKNVPFQDRLKLAGKRHKAEVLDKEGLEAFGIDRVRYLIATRAEELKISYASLSKALKKKDFFMNQFMTRRTPKTLDFWDCVTLATPLKYADPYKLCEQRDVDIVTNNPVWKAEMKEEVAQEHREKRAKREQEELEKHPPTHTHYELVPVPDHDEKYVVVPEVSASADAGFGQLNEEELIIDSWRLSREFIENELMIEDPSGLRVLSIKGDSMEPTIHGGDKVMVDTNDTNPSPAGIFVVWDGGGCVCKRVERVPGSEDPPDVHIMPDNTKYQSYTRSLAEAAILGRVVWLSRSMK